MSHTILEDLAVLGQSVWLDYINRSLVEEGKLTGMIAGGLKGVTSNPSIFNQVISESEDYDLLIKDLKDKGRSTFEIYDELTVSDITSAAIEFKEVHQDSNGLDGYVSLEINPLLADKVEEQIQEGKRLFNKVSKANVMIKVPSTAAGYKVIEALISEGINVNATLIFSLRQYEEVAKAYLRGISSLINKKRDPSKVRSVASVFVSRIDTAVDNLLDEKLLSATDTNTKNRIVALKGKAAVANSRLIFERAKALFASNEFKALGQKGANIQRVLWASTGTKNPKYCDIKYVKELISAPTVNTVPEATLNAFIDHGDVKEAFVNDAKESVEVVRSLGSLGISVDEVCVKLLDDGVKAFNNAFESLLESIAKKSQGLDVNTAV
ncbi:MAG: transaldolase [Omnitrophica WOR_2 bacterium GWF2_38_59]|nr:MAG: transaldolase [Omnitrophica WOR_2 bacterium GWA2_37_7]OGX25502.1 MAG: transaldolase [Omnitrophica WOR_2 bacterium GWF2_38_59]OGX48106.1 MAG: transaldolase [Omnitrophica WOR_2 bacterium RIFOXYA2_FULL_38_17]OGX54286.1 MAG: transaldolase [Omnitrophica WOR_2 bacterium RIFOXYA12_FULL_38_10]HBG62506.1 transaldolase [Candidatus Omnitrophota bacterium]